MSSRNENNCRIILNKYQHVRLCLNIPTPKTEMVKKSIQYISALYYGTGLTRLLWELIKVEIQSLILPYSRKKKNRNTCTLMINILKCIKKLNVLTSNFHKNRSIGFMVVFKSRLKLSDLDDNNAIDDKKERILSYIVHHKIRQMKYIYHVTSIGQRKV